MRYLKILQSCSDGFVRRLERVKKTLVVGSNHQHVSLLFIHRMDSVNVNVAGGVLIGKCYFYSFL